MNAKQPIPSRNLTGRAIKRIRMACEPKVTQDDLAGRLARLEITLTQAQVAKLENGQRPILDFELVAIAQALRVPVPVQRILDEVQSPSPKA